MTETKYERHSGDQMLAMLETIADIYAEIHSEDSSETDPLFSRESFIARTEKQARGAGFELITVMVGDVLAGFCFGLSMDAGKWWSDCTAPPREVLEAPKVAVIELDTRKPYRRRGLARYLLNFFLSDRIEEFVTLAATPDSLAYDMYIRWGWRKVSRFEDGPPMDALAVALK